MTQERIRGDSCDSARGCNCFPNCVPPGEGASRHRRRGNYYTLTDMGDPQERAPRTALQENPDSGRGVLCWVWLAVTLTLVVDRYTSIFPPQTKTLIVNPVQPGSRKKTMFMRLPRATDCSIAHPTPSMTQPTQTPWKGRGAAPSTRETAVLTWGDDQGWRRGSGQDQRDSCSANKKEEN